MGLDQNLVGQDGQAGIAADELSALDMLRQQLGMVDVREPAMAPEVGRLNAQAAHPEHASIAQAAEIRAHTSPDRTDASGDI